MANHLMPTSREYIGARYVPVFANPVEWSDTRGYEPLTMVTYEGATYITKQTVPPGIQIGNKDYWLLFSNFSAQLEAYAGQVRHLQDAVDGFQAGLDGLDKQVSLFSGTTDLGNYSDFNYALRPPASFDTRLFLSAAQKQWAWFKENNWTYGQNLQTTVPLLNLDTGETLNSQGAITSCSPAVASCLYYAGYTDLAGVFDMYSGTHRMRDYLLGKGWTPVSNQGELQAGDVVFQGWQADSEADDTPTHTFLCAGNDSRYDAGSTSAIRNGAPVAMNWSSLRPNINGVCENGLYALNASAFLHYPTPADNVPWKMLAMDTQGLSQLLMSRTQLVYRSLEGGTFEQRSLDFAARAPMMRYNKGNPVAPGADGFIPMNQTSYPAPSSLNYSTKPFTETENGIRINESGVYLIEYNAVYASDSTSETGQAIVSLTWTQGGAESNLVTGKESIRAHGTLSGCKILNVAITPETPVEVRLHNRSLNAGNLTFETGFDRTFIQVRQLA